MESVFFIFPVISTEQSHISDIPVWKSNRGPLQNQTGMICFFGFTINVKCIQNLSNFHQIHLQNVKTNGLWPNCGRFFKCFKFLFT